MHEIHWIARFRANQLDKYPIKWDEYSQVLEDLWGRANKESPFSFRIEIEENLTSIDNENKGMMYLGSLIDFYNEVQKYECQEFDEQLKLILQVFDPNKSDRAVERFRLATGNISLQIPALIAPISEYIPQTMWYKRHVDLFEQKGFGFVDSLPTQGFYSIDFEEVDRRRSGKTFPISAQPQPAEPGVKLKWGGSNDALYDLFAQLSLVNNTTNNSLLDNTIEELARFIATNVEGMPTAETIGRRIRAFREPAGYRPKRGRIVLDITKGE